jgi:hypothetical protein
VAKVEEAMYLTDCPGCQASGTRLYLVTAVFSAEKLQAPLYQGDRCDSCGGDHFAREGHKEKA